MPRTETAVPSPGTAATLPRTLRVVGASYVAFFGVGFVAVAADAPLPAGLVALTRWGHGGEAYELMITSLYVVWGAYLWRAARSPAAHATFLDFTLAANVAHFGVMLALAVLDDGEHAHLAGDVLLGWVAIAALAAAWLPHRRLLGRPPGQADDRRPT